MSLSCRGFGGVTHPPPHLLYTCMEITARKVTIINNGFHYSCQVFSFLCISCSSCWTLKKSVEVVSGEYFLFSCS